MFNYNFLIPTHFYSNIYCLERQWKVRKLSKHWNTQFIAYCLITTTLLRRYPRLKIDIFVDLFPPNPIYPLNKNSLYYYLIDFLLVGKEVDVSLSLHINRISGVDESKEVNTLWDTTIITYYIYLQKAILHFQTCSRYL